MTGPPAALDVKAAISTIDRAIAYTRPLRRRTEGITWVLFALSSALFVFSYAWAWDNGFDPTYKLILAWLAGYALLAVGPALLTWRIAGVMSHEYAIDAKRVVATVAVLGALLMALDLALWLTLGESPLTIALTIALFGGAAWAALGVAQWSRMSASGRRDTWIIGGAIAALGFALVFLFGADASTVALDVVIFALSTATAPLAAGLWRLARG